MNQVNKIVGAVIVILVRIFRWRIVRVQNTLIMIITMGNNKITKILQLTMVGCHGVYRIINTNG